MLLSTTYSKLNLTRLMRIYINSCGEYGICKDWTDLTGYEKNPINSRCPPCSCEDNCFRENTCCPDKFFQRKLTRFHDAVYQWSPFRDKNTYLPLYHVVDHCPAFAEVLDKCIKPDFSLEDRTFVTSLVSNYTYYNIHCALCHGENRSELVDWDISIAGTSNYVYFIESKDELKTVIKKRNSTVIFSPSPKLKDVVFIANWVDIRYLTEACHDDEDLHTACFSSYVNEFRLYKNVFCYLCKLKNIRKLQPNTITCPKSATDTIKKLCNDNPVSDLTYPYRNFYCFLCNIPSSNRPTTIGNMTYEYVFMDFFSDVREISERKEINRKKLVFYNNAFNNASIINKILNTKIVKKDNTSSSAPAKYITDRMESLLFKTSGYPHRMCNQDILPKFLQNSTIRNCDCTFSCLFKNPCSCCLDTAIIYPTKCIRNTWSQRILLTQSTNLESKIQIVHVCYEDTSIKANKEVHQKLKLLCEGDFHEFDYPVFSNKVTYKNVFCFLCNTNYTFENGSIFSEQFRILDIHILCNGLLQFDFALYFSQVLTLAIINNCDIVYDVDDAVLCQLDTVGTIKTRECPSVRREDRTDEIGIGVCKTTNNQSFFAVAEYTNEICYLCRKSSTWEIFDKTLLCTQSGTHHVIYKDTCLTLPYEQHDDLIHSFMNVFCSYCMEDFQESYHGRPSGGCIPLTGNSIRHDFHLMRDLFVPAMTLRASQFQQTSMASI
ncbi:uncharacterized protein LOC134243187 [Saccostrea cucullata]|uniref:uncharacterized protein LOC134243187 n=1 Tax=Saccostrea cuccullata TaxID=36930 RepID=UPI002ED309E5